MSAKTIKTATGIEGVRKFVATDADTTNWHIFTVDTYIGFTSGTAREWITKHGAKLIGFSGNGITVEI